MKNTAICRSFAVALGLLVYASVSIGQQTTGTKPEVGILDHKSEVIAIQNAMVVPEPGRVLENATIILRDGKFPSSVSV